MDILRYIAFSFKGIKNSYPDKCLQRSYNVTLLSYIPPHIAFVLHNY